MYGDPADVPTIEDIVSDYVYDLTDETAVNLVAALAEREALMVASLGKFNGKDIDAIINKYVGVLYGVRTVGDYTYYGILAKMLWELTQ